MCTTDKRLYKLQGNRGGSLISLINRRFGIVSLAAVTLLLLCSLAPAQGQIAYGKWRNINPTQYAPTATAVRDPLRSVYVRNGGSGAIGAGDGWAVGGTSGAIISHYDGFSWQIMASPDPGAQYYGVNFCTSPGAPGVGLCSPNGDGSDGWLVGRSSGGTGYAVYWDGAALTPVISGLGSAINITSVFMACHSPAYGSGCPGTLAAGLTYAVGKDATGGAIYAFNGNPKSGGGWSLQFDTSTATQFNSVYMFIDAAGNLGGFAVGYSGNNGVVARLNGGTWTASAIGGGATALLGVFVDSGNNGGAPDAWAVGRGGQLWHFSNGVWSGPASPAGTGVDLTGIFLVSTSEGWVVGQSSLILHSTSLGSSNVWSALTVPLFTGTGTGVSLLGVSFTGSGNGWAVGSEGVILQTGNSNCGSAVPSPCWGGSSDILESPAPVALTTVYEVGSSDAWVGGAFDSYSSTISLAHWDGIKWHRASAAPISVSQPDIYSIFMLGSGEGWAMGGSSSTPEALKWNGNSWTGQPIVACGGGSCEPRSVYMISGGTGGDGYAVGTGGHIWRYQSGAWGLIPTPTSNDLYSVFISNPGSSTNAGWAVGASGTFLRLSISSGIPSWTLASLPGITTQNLNSVYFKDSNHGWVVGPFGIIESTTDGGNTWSGGTGQVIGASNANLQSVFIDTYGTGSGSGDGWAVGDDGSGNSVFAHWDGQSWTNTPISPAITASPTGRLNSVYVTGPLDGWAVGLPVGVSILSAIYHLDPPNPHQIAVTTIPYNTITTTSTTTTSASSTSTSTTSSGSTTSTLAQLSTTISQTATSTTTQLSTSTSVSLSLVTVTASSTSVTTPLVVPAIPGFPLESIVAGIVLGLSALVVLRARRKT